MTAPAVGIDLGTTYSCVAVFRNGRAEVIQNSLGNRITPSVVSFGSERLIGEAAKEQEIRNAENTVFGVKRLIGRRYQDPGVAQDAAAWPFRVVDDEDRPKIVVQHEGVERSFFPEEISAMVLESMKATAEAYLGAPVRNAVVTVPAYFNNAQRQATRDAAVIAGLNVLRIINEPTASALAYGLNKITEDERYVLIYDLGGGTFDVSVLCIEEGIFEVRATAGDTRLGGDDIDALLAKHLAAEFNRRFNVDLSSNAEVMRRLRTASERAKRTLSSRTTAFVELLDLYNGKDFRIAVHRSKFQRLISPLVARTLELVRKVMGDANLKPSQLQAVLLVGGSTRIPMVRRLLREWFEGRELSQTVNPDEAVAIGAAVQASLLFGEATQLESDIVLLDVTPLTLGVATQGDIMVPLIDRNTPVPCERSRTFSTAVDNQAQVSVKVYEGERALATKNNELAKFILSGIPPAPRGIPQIEVKFHINENGILEVRAEEQGSKKQGKITIRNDRERLPRAEIQRLIVEAEKFREQDLKRGKESRARCRLEQLCMKFKERSVILPRERRPIILTRCDEVLKWLVLTPTATVIDCENKTLELNKFVKPFLAKA